MIAMIAAIVAIVWKPYAQRSLRSWSSPSCDPCDNLETIDRSDHCDPLYRCVAIVSKPGFNGTRLKELQKAAFLCKKTTQLCRNILALQLSGIIPAPGSTINALVWKLGTFISPAPLWTVTMKGKYPAPHQSFFGTQKLYLHFYHRVGTRKQMSSLFKCCTIYRCILLFAFQVEMRIQAHMQLSVIEVYVQRDQRAEEKLAKKDPSSYGVGPTRFENPMIQEVCKFTLFSFS